MADATFKGGKPPFIKEVFYSSGKNKEIRMISKLELIDNKANRGIVFYIYPDYANNIKPQIADILIQTTKFNTESK